MSDNLAPQQTSTAKAALIIAVVTIVFGSSMFFNPNGIASEDEFRNLDWLSCRIFDAYLYKSVHEFGQFPLWCPYLGGGYPIYQHPTGGSLTPFAIPVLLAGEIYGVKINLIILLFFGAFGVFLICRRIMGLGFTASIFSALTILVAGWFPSVMLVGFYNQAMYYLVPLIIYFLIRAYQDYRYAIPASILYALFAYQGLWGIFSLGIFSGFLCLSYCFFTPGRRFSFRPVIALTIVVAITGLIAMPRVLDIRNLDSQGEYPHSEEKIDDCSDENLPDTWERFYQGGGPFLYSALWHVSVKGEYDDNSYPTSPEYPFLGIPWVSFILFFLGVFVLRKRFYPWLITGSIILILTLGPNFPVNLYKIVICPFEVLQRMKDFFKYFNFFLLLVPAVGCGAFLGEIEKRIKSRVLSKAIILTAFASLVPFAIIHTDLFAELFKIDPPKKEMSKGFYQLNWQVTPPDVWPGLDYRELIRPPEFIAYYNIRRNVGTIDWYADIYLPEHARAKFTGNDQGGLDLNPEYRGEVYFEHESPNLIKNYTIKSNTITVVVKMSDPALLIVNQNFHRYWQADKGETANHGGLLAVNLQKPGEYFVKFKFVPVRFYLGVAFSILCLILCGLAWLWALPKKPDEQLP